MCESASVVREFSIKADKQEVPCFGRKNPIYKVQGGSRREGPHVTPFQSQLICPLSVVLGVAR